MRFLAVGVAVFGADPEHLVDVSFALLNLRLDDVVELGTNYRLRAMAPAEMRDKGLVRQRTDSRESGWGLVENDVAYAPWRVRHNALLELRAPVPARETGPGRSDYLLEPVLVGMAFSRLFQQDPWCSHMFVESGGGRGAVHRRHFGPVKYEPVTLDSLGAEKLAAIVGAVTRSDVDPVLSYALRRFVQAMSLGVRRGRANEANWDKVAEYVVALEALLLAAHKKSRTRESLSYRFSLNGSVLLAKLLGVEHETAFEALRVLYGIRSKVVHGEERDKVRKAVDSYLRVVGQDGSTMKHEIGRLMLLQSHVEAWFCPVFLMVCDMELEERPFNVKMGWEKLIWRGSSMPVK